MSPKVFEVLPSGGDGAGGKTLRRAVIGLVLFVVLILGAPVTVVPAGHVGVKDFFGRVSANALPAGVHLVFPFTRVHKMSIQTQEVKEIKMRPNIDDHDYGVKMRKINEFIEEGDKVKVTLRFRGRELAHGELGMQLLQRVQTDVAEVAKVEQHPRMEGRQMLMVIAPR